METMQPLRNHYATLLSTAALWRHNATLWQHNVSLWRHNFRYPSGRGAIISHFRNLGSFSKLSLNLQQNAPAYARDDLGVRPARRAAPAPPPVGQHEVEVRGERVERVVNGVQEFGGEGRCVGVKVGHGRERVQLANVCAALPVLLKQ